MSAILRFYAGQKVTVTLEDGQQAQVVVTRFGTPDRFPGKVLVTFQQDIKIVTDRYEAELSPGHTLWVEAAALAA